MESCSQWTSICKKLDDLPTLETSKMRLFNILEDKDASIKDVERIIEKDPAMAAKIVRLANAAFYRREAQAKSIHDAILTVGFDMVRCITISMAVMHTLGKSTVVSGRIWRHSTAVSVFAFGLGKDKAEKEILLSGGLLHDLGRMAFLYIEPDMYAPLFRDGWPGIDLEQGVFSVDHTIVGEMIAKKWRFPSEVIDIIRTHHNPHNRLSALIYLIDCIVSEHDNNSCIDHDVEIDLSRADHLLGPEYKDLVNDIATRYKQEGSLIEGFV